MPHEAEIKKRGLRHLSPTDRFIACTGWLSTTYAIDLPALGGARVEWKSSASHEAVAAAMGRSPAKTAQEIFDEKHHKSTGPNADGEASAANKSRDLWTPIPTQVLTKEKDDVILATYTRSAPWAKHSGISTIPQVPPPSDHLVEDIAIVCAAMVGMQDRIGLTSALIESGYDNTMGGTGKSRSSKG